MYRLSLCNIRYVYRIINVASMLRKKMAASDSGRKLICTCVASFLGCERNG